MNAMLFGLTWKMVPSWLLNLSIDILPGSPQKVPRTAPALSAFGKSLIIDEPSVIRTMSL